MIFSKLWRWFVVLVLAQTLAMALFAEGTAHAETPCSQLSEEANKEYFELSIAAVEAYSAGDFAKAVEKNLEAWEICDEDPGLLYNLARAYQKGENCPMALLYFDRLEARDPGRKLKKKMKKYQAQALELCGDTRADFTLSCEDVGVEVDIDPLGTVFCPYEGALVAGSYKVFASKPEHRPFQTEVELKAGEENVIRVSALVPDAWFGRLSVTCSPNVSFFLISGPDGDDQKSCPWEGELGVGTYTLQAEKGDAVVVDVVGNELVTAKIDVPQTPFERGGLVLGGRIFAGGGYFSGDLNGDEAREGEHGEGLSIGSAGLHLDLGYAFNAEWAALARLRVDYGLGIAGGLLGRYAFLRSDSFAMSALGGVLGGSMVQPVFTDDSRMLEAEAGPVFFLLGGQFLYAFSETLALNIGLDLYLDFVDGSSEQTDLSLGIEMKF